MKLRIILAALSAIACAGRTEQTATATAVTPPEWTRSAVMYEVNVRQYTPEGTLAALLPHLTRLDSLGVDILWLMPVQPIGRERRKGVLGSYYSIANYTAINPDYGSAADFRAFVDSAHALGMRVVLDWVANHTAFDHHWVAEHPDWYVRRPDGTISNARDNEGRETDWTDVAELNYDNAAMRRAMLDAMKWWVDSMNVDGFRADVAGGVPDEFWTQARRELEELRPDIFLLAEAESPAMHATFDMTYGWELHHLLNAIAQGKQPVARLAEYFAEQQRRYPAGAYRMYFTSNHDENSWQGSEFERMGDNHRAAFVLAATAHSSMPLLYTGQEASLNKRLRFFEKDTVDWNGPSLADFYRSLFELKDVNPALWNGAYGGGQEVLRTEGSDNVFAYARVRDSNTVVVAVNFGAAPAQAGYSGLAAAGVYRDWFTGQEERLEPSGRLEIPAHGYRVLVRGGLTRAVR